MHIVIYYKEEDMFTMLEIREYRPEMDAFSYFRWILNRWVISFYKEEKGLFQFRIDLPFIHITNTIQRRVVREPVYTSDGPVVEYFKNKRSRVLSIITGRVFWWEIKI